MRNTIIGAVLVGAGLGFVKLIWDSHSKKKYFEYEVDNEANRRELNMWRSKFGKTED